MNRRLWIFVHALAALCIACGPDVQDVCDNVDDECSDVPYDECIEEGENLQRAAEDFGCDQQFEIYIDCVFEVGCSWRTSCEVEGEALFGCVEGGVP